MKQGLEKAKTIRGACLANAEALLASAERGMVTDSPHIPFHLGILAFEEIGKAVIAGIKFAISDIDEEEFGPGGEDDHVRKLFWAIWGGPLRSKTFTVEEIESNRRLATYLHEKRVSSLYTDSTNPVLPEIRVSKKEAEDVLALARTRLEMEKDVSWKEDHSAEAEAALKWFFTSAKIPEKRAEIFSFESVNKLAEFQDGEKWMTWLKEREEREHAEQQAIAIKEINRSKPSEEERFDPKYKLRIRVQSLSHSIHNKAFDWWNVGVNDIKIHKIEKKHLSNFAKAEIYVDFLFPKAIPVQALWEHGMFMSKTFIVALCASTKGFFWWEVQKQPEKYYEEILDVDADKNGRVGLKIALGQRLNINWEDARFKLVEGDMKGVSMMLGFIYKHHKKLQEFLRRYNLGLAVFSKTDIHLRMETNAFIEFYNALKEVMRSLGDWDGQSDFKTAVLASFAELPDLKEIENTLSLGAKAETIGAALPEISLTEVMAMKLYTDLYLILTVNRYFKQLPASEAGG